MERATEQKLSVFYSWQSGDYDRENRYLIWDCLKRAANALGKEGISVHLDQDTRDLPGAPDISQAVLQKIEAADLFVADVSIINPDAEAERKTPNPNVMLESGYAAAKLGWDRLTFVLNEKMGTKDDMPFDIRNHRLTSYNSARPLDQEKKMLTQQLINAMRHVRPVPKQDAEVQQAKQSLAQLLTEALRHVWRNNLPSEGNDSSEKDDIRRYKVTARRERAPKVLAVHFQQLGVLQSILTEEHTALLADWLDIAQKMRDGTEDVDPWEYTDDFAELAFEQVWLEYSFELPPVPMEQCLTREAVSLLNCLLPADRQLTYQSKRTTISGATVFLVEETHLEAYAADGVRLLDVTLDERGRITGWKKDDDYAGYFTDGVRHGEGTEYIHDLHHPYGVEKCSGRWEKGQFVEGTIYQVILFQDESQEDGYAYEADPTHEDLPLQLFDRLTAESLIRNNAPEECDKFYVADMRLHDGVYDIIGAPKPLCRRLGGELRPFCLDCPRKTEEDDDFEDF